MRPGVSDCDRGIGLKSFRGAISGSTTPAAAIAPPSAGQTASVFGTCRLPVMAGRTPGAPRSGWLNVPAGSFSLDQATLPFTDSNVLAWDAGEGRWVPTWPRYISPDGTNYLADGGTAIVDARTGAVGHPISYPDRVGPFLVGYTAAAIYFASGGKDPLPGLWKLDAASGKVTQVSSAAGEWDVADDAAAWGVAGPYGPIRRLDLSTGAVSDVFKTGENSPVVVAGFAGSGVLVMSSGASETLLLWVVHGDGSVVPVEVPRALQHARLGNANSMLQDGPAMLFVAYYPLDWPEPPAGLHGWGLAAYDPEHGLQLAAANTPPEMFLLGRCMSM